jgi:hypothetical protein
MKNTMSKINATMPVNGKLDNRETNVNLGTLSELVLKCGSGSSYLKVLSSEN